jgi:hypothetical protein
MSEAQAAVHSQLARLALPVLARYTALWEPEVPCTLSALCLQAVSLK